MLGDSTLLVLGTFGRHVVLVQGVLAGRPPLELGLLLALGCLGVVGRACMRRVPRRCVCVSGLLHGLCFSWFLVRLVILSRCYLQQ